MVSSPKTQTLIRRDGIDLTGMAHVTATVRNMADPKRSWTGKFRVDPNVIDCVVPRTHLQEIGLSPKGQRAYETEDGGTERVDVTTAELEAMGKVVGATVVMGDEEGEAVLGRGAFGGAGIRGRSADRQSNRLSLARLP